MFMMNNGSRSIGHGNFLILALHLTRSLHRCTGNHVAIFLASSSSEWLKYRDGFSTVKIRLEILMLQVGLQGGAGDLSFALLSPYLPQK